MLSCTFTRVVSVNFSPRPWFQRDKLPLILLACFRILGTFILHVGKHDTVVPSELGDWRALARSHGWASLPAAPRAMRCLHPGSVPARREPMPSSTAQIHEEIYIPLCKHLILFATSDWEGMRLKRVMELEVKTHRTVLMVAFAAAKQKRGDDENWKRNSNGAQLPCIKWETNTD